MTSTLGNSRDLAGSAKGAARGLPLVSIVIPAYNAEPFIERTLRSALRQTYAALEIIVVDDGSTDRTAAIVTEFARANSRLRMISIPNGGVARARNLGIERSAGAYVAFLDADDLWHPTKVEEQVRALELKGGDDWAACYVLHRGINRDDEVLYTSRNPAVSGYILARHFFSYFVGNGSSLLVRREAAIAVGGFDPWYADNGIGGTEDLDFELKLAARYRIVGLPLYLVGYRLYDGNMSSNRERMARALMTTINRHLVANPELPPRARAYAMGTAYAFVTTKAVEDRRLKDAARIYATFLRTDAPRAAAVGYQIFGRFARVMVRRVMKRSGTVHRPTYDQLDGGIALSAEVSPMRWRRLAALQSVDEGLWAALRQRQTVEEAYLPSYLEVSRPSEIAVAS